MNQTNKHSPAVPQLVIVGSVALDSVSTTEGRVERALGGSAVYCSLAASLFTRTGVVGVVGRDFSAAHLALLRNRGVDVSGIEIREGKTFFWEGSYGPNFNEAVTRRTDLNVFGDFKPVLGTGYRRSPYLFLANIHPSLQLSVLSQIRRPRWIAMDTMNFWIQGEKKTLMEVIRRVQIVFLNETEARLLTGERHLGRAAEAILRRGPAWVLIKRGEYGACAFSKKDFLSLPAYLVDHVKDPTGAGDTFAGAFLGSLAKKGVLSAQAVRSSLVTATAAASFTVEDFSVGALKRLTGQVLSKRIARFRKSSSV